VKHAAEWLLERNVATVYVGDLSDVLETHWSAEINEKTHAFWAYRQLLNRIELTFGDVGIDIEVVSEAGTSSHCPVCETEHVQRTGDSFQCLECGLEAHSDIVGAWNILQKHGPMARPAALSAGRHRDAATAYWEWDGHDWRSLREQSGPLDQTSLSKPVSSQPG